jgi:hypothetical protein
MSELELALTMLEPLPWWTIALIAIGFTMLLMTEDK